MNRPPYPSTPKLTKQWFKRHGICISEWCRSHQLAQHTVTDLLRGKSKGNHGNAHKAAILLGLKPDPERPWEAA